MYMIATALSALLLSFVGSFIDHYGVRVSGTLIPLCLGGACWYISEMHSEYALPVGFFFLRFFGQGGLFLVSKTAINLWWVDRRGVIMGIGGGIAAFGISGVAPLVTRMMIRYCGWRCTYKWYTFLQVNMAVVGYCFFREKPENYGLLPDGKEKTSTYVSLKTDGKLSMTKLESGYTREEALKTKAFWVISFSALAFGLVSTAWWFFLPDILGNEGVPESVITVLYPTIAICAVVARFASGKLLDFLSEKNIISIGLLSSAASFWALLLLNVSPAMAICSGALLAIANAFVLNMLAVVWANIFGRAHVGAISSTADSLLILGTSAGPLFFGLVKDYTGDYFIALVFGAVMPLIFIALLQRYGDRPKFAMIQQLPEEVEIQEISKVEVAEEA